MYAKIYKEIFIKGYALKKQIKDNIWVVKIDNTDYYLSVYKDEEIEGFGTYDEAELLQYKYIDNTEKRIFKNREFLQKIKEFKKSNSYLFRTGSNNQACLFSFDTFYT